MKTTADRLRQLSAECPEVEALVIFSDENRRYLSGFSGSSGALVVHDGHGELITDSRYWEQAETEAPDLALVRQSEPLWPAISSLVADRGFQTIGFEEDRVTVEAWNWLRSSVPNVAWVGLSGKVEKLRIKKDASELKTLELAAHIGSEALEQTLRKIRPGVEEHEIAVELEWQMRKLGSDGLSFATILVSGPRSSLPHGRPTRRRVQSGDLITIDFGATVAGYHSDETITVALGEVSEEARSVFDVVCLAQSLAIDSVRPGRLASEVDQVAREVIETAGFGAYFRHSTGHGVGLEVHEAPMIAKSPAYDWTLEEGMVLTVEPGIYLAGRFGVRLEDTMVVTREGSDRLTKLDKAWRVL